MIIHQIWFQGPNVPENYSKNVIKLKELNPDYDYILWSEKSFLEKYGNILSEEYYKLTLMHLKIDYMRYVILYNMGGIYVDMDTEAIKSFNIIKNDIEKYDTILSKLNRTRTEALFASGYNYLINNGIIIAKKNSTYLGILLDNINDKIKRTNFDGILEKTLDAYFLINEVTGPRMCTVTYNELEPNIMKNILVLRNEYFEPCSKNNCIITDRTIIIHRQDMTWLPSEYTFLRKLYSDEKLYMSICIIIILISFYFLCKGYYPLVLLIVLFIILLCIRFV